MHLSVDRHLVDEFLFNVMNNAAISSKFLCENKLSFLSGVGST